MYHPHDVCRKEVFHVPLIPFSKPSNPLFHKHHVDVNNDNTKKNQTDEPYNALNLYHQHIKLIFALVLDPNKFLNTQSTLDKKIPSAIQMQY